MKSSFVRHTLAVVLAISLSGCALYESNPRTVQGAGIGAAGGAATGAAIGAVVGGGKGAGKGAAIGAVVGLLGGGFIGNYMDRQAEEMRSVLAEQDRIRREQDRLDINLSSDVLFSSGSAELYPGGRQKLAQVATILTRYPESTVQIVGHTDSRGSEQSNLELSQKRAQAVASELMAAGVAAHRISTSGRGESVPIATNDTAEGRAQNRRVDLIVLPSRSLQEQQNQQPTGSFEEPR